MCLCHVNAEGNVLLSVASIIYELASKRRVKKYIDHVDSSGKSFQITYIYIYPLFFFILLLFSVICNPRYSTFSFKRKTELKLKRRIYSNLNKIGKKNWEPTNNLRLLPINPPSIVYTESTSSFAFSLYFFFKLCFFLKTIKVKRSNRICWTIL